MGGTSADHAEKPVDQLTISVVLTFFPLKTKCNPKGRAVPFFSLVISNNYRKKTYLWCMHVPGNTMIILSFFYCAQLAIYMIIVK